MAGRSPSREQVVRKRDGSPLDAPEQQPLDVMPLQHQEQRQPRQDRHHPPGHHPLVVLHVPARPRRTPPRQPPQGLVAEPDQRPPDDVPRPPEAAEPRRDDARLTPPHYEQVEETKS